MSPKTITIVCLPGDGVGPEVVGEAVKILNVVSAHRSKALNVEFKFVNELIGLASLEKTGKLKTRGDTEKELTFGLHC
jgi:3-isopropylmalate dehydrogenase